MQLTRRFDAPIIIFILTIRQFVGRGEYPQVLSGKIKEAFVFDTDTSDAKCKVTSHISKHLSNLAAFK